MPGPPRRAGYRSGVAHRYAFLDAPTPLAFAHRGAPGDGLENSLSAFEGVLDLGYRYLETDVRATADGVVVAFHDPTLDRVTDRTGHIADLPYREVARARIGGVAPIPRLEDLLGEFPDIRVNIDVKVPAAVRPVIDVITRTGALDRVCVAAFSDARVAAVRAALGPRLCTSLGPRGVLRLRLASYGRFRGPVDGSAGCAQVPPRAGPVRVVDGRFLAAAHRRGLQVHVWTLNDAASIHAMLDLGVDGVMTDDAALLREVLLARGQWHG